mmetsp:Transcript_43778/g.102169  ORF Transcript_43778/g.102169 Transcript_43778/m.102169 type:complete len:356 (-) Transcript_43778:195-1262(-)
MDLTIYVQSCGATAAFALCLDVLPHQVTAIAHISSILQMCSMYAESRPNQAEALQQLKGHVEKLNYIQKKILMMKRRNSQNQARARPVRPLPAILASDASASADSVELRESNPDSQDKALRRAVTDKAQSSQERSPEVESGSFEEECRPIVKNLQKARAQTVPRNDDGPGSGSAASAGADSEASEKMLEQEPSHSLVSSSDNMEALVSLMSIPHEEGASAPGAPFGEAPSLLAEDDEVEPGQFTEAILTGPPIARCHSAPEAEAEELPEEPQDSLLLDISDSQVRKAKSKAKTTSHSLTSGLPSLPVSSWISRVGRFFHKGATKVSPEDAITRSTPLVPSVKEASDAQLRRNTEE